MSEGFIDELRNTLDRGAVLSGDDIDARYHHDSAGNPVPKPRAVVRPRTTEDVSALLRLCHREGVPVTTQGGMTGLVRAALPNAGGRMMTSAAWAKFVLAHAREFLGHAKPNR